MAEEIKAGLVGGDRRMLSTASCLSERYECAVWGFSEIYGGADEEYLKNSVKCVDWMSAVSESDVVVLPLPVSNDGVHLRTPLEKNRAEPAITEICGRMKRGSLLLGGMLPPFAVRFSEECGIECVDYYDCEEMQILNSVPTAEGAIKACMDELDITVSGMKAAVIGYGRVGRTLANKLKMLGADVFAVARSKKDLSWAKCDGCIPTPLSEYREVPLRCDAVFNTVPALVFDEELLNRLEKKTVLFELAAKNSGVDLKSAERVGIRTVCLPSLPGKVAPETAGEIICGVVGSIISEKLK